MALIKSTSTLEVIRYIPSKKGKTKLPIILKRTKQRTRVCNVLAGLCMGLYLGLILRPKFLSLVSQLPAQEAPGRTSDSVTSQRRGVGFHDDREHGFQDNREHGFHDNRESERAEAARIVNLTGLHGSERLLFVGVMTANAYLSTRAASVYETWAQDIPGRVAFFSSEGSRLPSNRPDLPLVKLRGVDDSYPPQKKSFMMLAHMWEHYGRDFEWFMRADDDVYVRTDRLEKILRSVDSRKPQFIGQAGRGNQEEFGLLSLEYDENFCMGGPGVLLSRATLALVAPHIRHCLRNLYTTHEDVELGRCVQKFAGIPCTWSYEMQHILYHNSSGRNAFTGDLKVKEVHRAMTLHPVKQHKHMYRIHNYMRGLKIHDLQQDMLLKHRDLLTMLTLLGKGNRSMLQGLELSNNVPLFEQTVGQDGYLGDPFLLGKQPSLLKAPQSLIPWSFVARSVFSPGNLNPKKRLESHLREGLDDVIREVMENLNQFSRERGRMIEFKELLYGYHRENTLYGADYILDLLLIYKKYRGRKMTVPVRKHVYLQQQFTGLEIRELEEGMTPADLKPVPKSSGESDGVPVNVDGVLYDDTPPLKAHREERGDKTVINFILGLSGRFETFQRFMENFERVCLRRDRHVNLYIVLFPPGNTGGNYGDGNTAGNYGDGNSVNRTRSLVNALNARYRRKISVVPVFDTFSRAKALQIGASQVRYPQDLLFFIDVDILFTRRALDRIRANTVRMRQVYFPIVFSQYDPALVYNSPSAPDHFRISEEAGYWRTFGFGIAAMYKTDFDKVGGFDSSISGWGKEDVDLFDKFVRGAADTPSSDAADTPSKSPPQGDDPAYKFSSPVDPSPAESRRAPHIFRAPDPELVHVYHAARCEPHDLDASQYRMCVNSRADTLASVQTLGDFIRRNSDYFGNRTGLV